MADMDEGMGGGGGVASNQGPVNEGDPHTMGNADVRWALNRMKDCEPDLERFRKQARNARRAEASHYFTKDDLEKLKDEGRPSAVFNKALKFIKFVAGMEAGARRDIRFLARVMESDERALEGDNMTGVYNYIIENCHGNSERSRAFYNSLIVGIGCTDGWLDDTIDPDGKVRLTCVPEDEFGWDTRARMINLEDAQFVWRKKRIPMGLAKVRWPKSRIAMALQSEGDTKWVRGDQPAILKSEREAVPTHVDQPVGKGEVEVTEFQWWKEVPGMYFVDPFSGKFEWLPEDEFENYRSRYNKMKTIGVLQDQLPEEIDFEPKLQRVYRRMMLCGSTLLAGPDKLPGRRFTYNFITGSWDADEKTWWGLFKLLMDPERYFTKLVNLAMEIVARHSKGGLFAESDAFINKVRAEQEYAKSGSITWLKPGAIREQKIKEKEMPQIPTAVFELVKLCGDMNEQVMGISPRSAMGAVGAAAGANVPTSTFLHQQLAQMALLQLEFSALDRYRINEARTIMDFLPYISDGRLARIVGPFESKVIPLTRDPLTIDYDLVIDDESERDPNQRMQYLQTLKDILPTLIRTNQFVPEMLDFLPLPRRFIIVLKDSIKQHAQQEAQMAAMGLSAGGGRKGSPLEIRAKAKKMDADTRLADAKAASLVKNTETTKIKTILDALIAAEESLQGAADVMKPQAPPPQGGGGEPSPMPPGFAR